MMGLPWRYDVNGGVVLRATSLNHKERGGLVTMHTTSCTGNHIWLRTIRFEIFFFLHSNPLFAAHAYFAVVCDVSQAP